MADYRKYGLYTSDSNRYIEALTPEMGYVLESIDWGNVKEDMEKIDYQIGSEYLTSSIRTRSIDMVVWCTSRSSILSEVLQPDRVLVLERMRKLQSVCAPLEEFEIRIRERDINYENVASIKVRLESSIEWGKDENTNNEYVCKAIIHLVALNPFFSLPIIKKTSVTPDTWYIRNLGDPTIHTDIITRYSNKALSFNNIGSNPFQSISCSIKTSTSVNINGTINIRYQDISGRSYGTAKFKSATGNSYTISSNNPMIYDSVKQTCSVVNSYGNREELIAIGDYPKTNLGYMRVFFDIRNSSGSSDITDTLLFTITSGLEVLEV